MVIDFWTRRRLTGLRIGPLADAAKYRRPSAVGVDVGVTGKAWRRVGEKKRVLKGKPNEAEFISLEKAVSTRFVKIEFYDDEEDEAKKAINVRFDLRGCTLNRNSESTLSGAGFA